MRRWPAHDWGAAKSQSARPAPIPIGIAWGSGYQNRWRNMPAAQQSAALAKMVASGISWARIDCEWWTVQPTSGGFDFSTVDPVVTALRAAGIDVLLLLNTVPGWALRPAGAAPLFAPNPTPDPARYAAYCAAAVAHFTPLGVRAFELWNEPNLTSRTSLQGWSYRLAQGYAELATAAYPAMKAAAPGCYILGGTLATSPVLGAAGTARTCTWGQVSAGASTATVTCGAAAAGEAPGFLAGGGWPDGSLISAVTPGVGYTVAPPPWSSGGFPAVAAGSGTLMVQNTQLAPDFFLDRVYQHAAGAPWCDALAVHPYTQPSSPQNHGPNSGGWAVVPNLRRSMVANGDGAKPVWITEVGAPSGGATAAWPAAAATDTTLTLLSPRAAAADLRYAISGGSLPAGCWISAVAAGTSWTVSPPTGITLAAALAAGTAVSTLTVAATPIPRTIPSGTVLAVCPPVTSGNWVPAPLLVTTSGAVTTSATGQTAVPVTPVTPGFAYPVGAPILGAVGQTFGAPVPAASSAAVTLAAPGVPMVWGQLDEPGQAQLIADALRCLVSGHPNGTPPWPFATGTPVFLFCWADSNAGSFGLERVDGTNKPSLTTLRRLTRPSASYDTVILGDRPVGYWPLATGTTVVDRIGTATAVYTGSPAAATLPNGDPAVAFTTSGQYATVPDADAFSVPTTGQLTLELWIRPDVYDFPDAETSTDGPLVYPLYKGNRTGPGGNIEYAVRMYSRSSTRPNRMSAYLFAPDGGLGAGSYAEDPIILSGWVHLVAVFDGVNKGPDGWGTVTWYKNGIQRDSDTWGDPYDIVPVNGDSPIYLGGRPGHSSFQGGMGKVAIYDRALTAAQVARHFAAMQPSGGVSADSGPSLLSAGFAGVATWTSTQQQVTEEMQLAAAAGATMVRCDLYWDLVEQSRGTRDWTRPDMMFDAADAAGLRILWVPNQSPAWARTAGEASNIYLPTNPATYGDFVAAAVARYATRGTLGSHHWQLWNEVNTTYHNGDPTNKAAYVALAADAYSKIKVADPAATVVLGSILRGGMASGQYGTYQDDLYLADLYTAGIRPFFDVLAYHPYSYPFDPADTIDPVHTEGVTVENGWQGLAAIRAVAVAKGDGGKPLWVTEVGQHTGTATYAVGEPVQAGYIGHAFTRARSEGVARMFWFALRDAGTDATVREQNFGVVKADFTAKAALRTFRAAAAIAAGGPAPVVTTAPAPTFVTSVDSGVGFAATRTTPAVAGSQTDDVLVAFAQANDQAATVTASESGWRLRGTVALDNGRILVFTKTATGAQGAVTWTYSGTHNHRVTVACYRGGTEPTTLAAAAANRVKTATLPNLLLPRAGARLVVAGFAASNTDATTAITAGMTARTTVTAAVAGGVVADQAFTNSDDWTGEKTYSIGASTGATLIMAAAVVIPGTATPTPL
jgi:hypothetical protein